MNKKRRTKSVAGKSLFFVLAHVLAHFVIPHMIIGIITVLAMGILLKNFLDSPSQSVLGVSTTNGYTLIGFIFRVVLDFLGIRL